MMVHNSTNVMEFMVCKPAQTKPLHIKYITMLYMDNLNILMRCTTPLGIL